MLPASNPGGPWHHGRMTDVPSISASEVAADTVVLDVREDDEWQCGHIEGALHIPLTQLMERYGEVPADVDVVVVCRTGGRSYRAVQWLNQNGFEAVNLLGGMAAWDEARLPMVSESDQAPFVK